MRTELCVFLILVTWVSGFVNLAHDTAKALQGTANMSEPPQKPAWSAGNAVDGNTDQELLTSCVIMDYTNNYKTVWWKVRLQNRFNVAYLEVYFRGSTITRSSGYYFYSYDSSEVFDPNSLNQRNFIYHHDPISGCPASIKNITVNKLAQEIVFINKRPSDYRSNCAGDNLGITTVEICEVKVMGCDSNRYSYSCGNVCDYKCKLQRCDAFNGSCIYGCTDANALTIDCVVCQDGQYLSNKVCRPCPGHCKDGAPCNKSTGRCDNGCSNYWTGIFCETCPLGYYGDDCNNVCGKCAGNDVCNNHTGDCPGECLGNWQKPKCNDCKDRFYGNSIDCAGTCGHCIANNICNKDTGDCPGGCAFNYLSPLCQEIINSKFQEERRTDDDTSFSWSNVVIGILGILLTIAVAYIVYLKRQRPTVQHDKQKTSTQNYDNLTVLKENHQYATMNSETNESHYQELPETV
uniref:Laminin subunit alpha-1-like n=1 Tax=Crassostrea virginica TaxID=6565 RepID=A0A8B8BPK1_CRAVI|nr:laminin subunit alpha-1-like [Crassostrea virginica]